MAEQLKAIKSGIVPVLPKLNRDITLNFISVVDNSINSIDIKGSINQYNEKILENSTPLWAVATDFIFTIAEGEQLGKNEGWLVAVANAIKHGFVTTRTVKSFGFSERACDAGVKKGFLKSLYEFIDLRPKVYILAMLYPILDPYLVTILPNVKFNSIVKNKFKFECKPTLDGLINELESEKWNWNPYNKLLVMYMDRVIEGYDARTIPPPLIEDNFNFRAAVRDGLESLMDIKKAWHSYEAKKLKEEQLREYVINNIAFIKEQCYIA